MQRRQGERLLTLLGAQIPLIAEAMGTVPAFVLRSLAKLDVPDLKLPRWESEDGVHWTWRLPWSVGGEMERQSEIRAMIALGRRLAKESGRAV